MSLQQPIDIVIVAYLRFEMTEQCLKHIVERTSHPYRINLVVNGANEHPKAVLEAYSAFASRNIVDNLLLLGENYGIHAAKNAGLSLVHSFPYYIDMDNDILVPKLEPDWIIQLIGLMDKYRGFGSISLRPQVLVGRSGHEFDGDEEVVNFSHTGAHGRIMRTEVVKRVGGWRKVWDAKRNNEDSWIAGKLHEEKLDSGYAKNLRCWHQFGDGETSDPWGYNKDDKPEAHGHVERWPPVNTYAKKEKFDPITWEPKK